MLIVDTNVLTTAISARAHEHALARDWWEATLSADETVGMPWLVTVAFLRLTTRPGALERPLAAEVALDLLGTWLDRPNVTQVDPTPRHFPLLRSLLKSAGAAGNLVNDGHLAALALEYDATVISFDRDFGRFEGVKWRLPE